MTFLESVLTQFFAPAEQAAIPLLVPGEHLLAANSLYQATSMGATIVGFALGEPILRALNQSLFALHRHQRWRIPALLLPGGCASLSTIGDAETREHDNIGIRVGLVEEIGEGLRVLVQRSQRCVAP